MQLRFVPSESTDSYFEALGTYLASHGCPVAFYSDKHSVFKVNKPDAKGGSGMTQFGRALAELNIEIICANTSQAKGRVERANRTLAGSAGEGTSAGERVRHGCWQRASCRSSCCAITSTSPCSRLEPEDLHQSLNVAGSRLNEILCNREQRHVSQQLSISYERKQIILERSEVADGLGGKYVDLYHFPDGRIEVRWKGVSLPYRIFSKDQRVSHTAVVENKRLGHALSLIRAAQKVKHEPKVQTNSEKLGYKKHPRKVYGPDYEEPSAPPAKKRWK